MTDLFHCEECGHFHAPEAAHLEPYAKFVTTLEVTAEELKMITEKREEQDVFAVRKRLKLDILKTAYEFDKWLRENGEGATYSTFCDGFQYPYKDREVMFRAIQAIRNHAWVLSDRTQSTSPEPDSGGG